MINFFFKNRYILTSSLLISTLILSFVVALRLNIVSEEKIKNNKEIIGIFFQSINAIIVVAGAFFAYYKFFKGQLFLSKINLLLSHQVVPINVSENLIFIEIMLENIGSISVFNPDISIKITKLGFEEEKVVVKLMNSETRLKSNNVYYNTVVRPQTTFSIPFESKMPKEVFAFKCEVVCRIDNREWSKVALVINNTNY